MKITINETDFSPIAHLWRDDTASIKERKKEWTRSKGVFSGWPTDEIKQLKEFMVFGTVSDLVIAERNLLTLAPWSTLDELMKVCSFMSESGRSLVVSGLTRDRFVEYDKIYESANCLRYVGDKAEVLRQLLQESELDFSVGLTIRGVILPFDFMEFCSWYESFLYFTISRADYPTDYFVECQPIYFGFVRYAIKNNIAISHSENLCRLLAVANNYSPMSTSLEGMDKKKRLAKDFCDQITSSDFNKYFVTQYGSSFNEIKTFSVLDEKKEELKPFAKTINRFVVQRFVFDVNIPDLIKQLAFEMERCNVCAEVKVANQGDFDLSLELEARGAKALGVTVGEQVPVRKWTLTPILEGYVVRLEGEETILDMSDLMWVEVYSFLSEDVIPCGLGGVSGIVCVRFSSVLKECLLDLVTSHFCRAIDQILVNITQDKYRLLIDQKTDEKQYFYFESPPLRLQSAEDVLFRNFEGFKERAL